MLNRVVVVIEGGAVQSVASDDPDADVILIDWDNIKQMDTDDLVDFRDEICTALADDVGGDEDVRRFLLEAQKRLNDVMMERG